MAINKYKGTLFDTLLTGLLVLCSSILSAQTINTVAGIGTGSHTGNGGAALQAGIGQPMYIAFDHLGNYYFIEDNGVRKVSASGIISAVAGPLGPGYNGDSIPATTAWLSNPTGIAVDKDNNVLIGDENHSRIRKVDVATGLIYTVIGTGVPGFGGDGGPANLASIAYPTAIAFDTAGNLYFSDFGNNRIRKVDLAGNISTIGGTGTSGDTGDGGPATAANITDVAAMRISKLNNLYFTTGDKIRKIDLNTGMISTVAGSHSTGYAGDGGPAVSALFYAVIDIALDDYGNLYVSDLGNSRIRKIDVNGIINTVAGTGVQGWGGDGGPANAATFNEPYGIAFDSCGNLFIADSYNGRIRKVDYNPPCFPASVHSSTMAAALSLYPNPVQDVLTINLPQTAGLHEVAVMNVMGQEVMKQSGRDEQMLLHMAGLQAGVYFITISEENGVTVCRRVVKE